MLLPHHFDDGFQSPAILDNMVVVLAGQAIARRCNHKPLEAILLQPPLQKAIGPPVLREATKRCHERGPSQTAYEPSALESRMVATAPAFALTTQPPDPSSGMKTLT